MQNGGQSSRSSWSVGTGTVLLSEPVGLGSSTALFEPSGGPAGQLDSFRASAVPAGSSGGVAGQDRRRPDAADVSGRSQPAEVVKHGRLAGSARAPHQQATWILTSVSFGALLVAAIVWSLVVSGRWFAVGSIEVAIVFVVLMARGHYRVRMVTELFAELPVIGAAVGLAGTAGIGVAASPWLGQPELSMFLLLSLFLFVAVVGARAIGVGVLRALWGRGLLRSKAIVYGVDQLSRELEEAKKRSSDLVDGFALLHADQEKELEILKQQMEEAGQNLAAMREQNSRLSKELLELKNADPKGK